MKANLAAKKSLSSTSDPAAEGTTKEEPQLAETGSTAPGSPTPVADESVNSDNAASGSTEPITDAEPMVSVAQTAAAAALQSILEEERRVAEKAAKGPNAVTKVPRGHKPPCVS